MLKNVKEAARFLDEKYPGWANKINVKYDDDEWKYEVANRTISV